MRNTSILIRRSEFNVPDAAEEVAAISMRFASGLVGTSIISDHEPLPHGFEQGTNEDPSLPSSDADLHRIFGANRNLSFPNMIVSSYASIKESWENTVRMYGKERTISM